MTDGRNPLRFTPRLLPTLAMVALLPPLLWLGSWQLERAAEKQQLTAAFDAAQLASSVPYATGLPRFTRVVARGRWDGARQFLLDAMVLKGQTGFRVLTPLRLDDDRVVLVDRGWVAGDLARRTLPEVPLASLDVVEVTGLTDSLPRPGIAVGAAADAGTSTATAVWPRVVLYPTHEELAQALMAPLEPTLLRLDPAAPDGYARGFAPDFGVSRERHLAYAVTWFALAITLLAIWIGTNLSRKEG